MREYKRSVVVRDGNVEKALRKFKKKVQESGLLEELRERLTYEKPTTERKRKKGAARARLRKQIRQQQLPKNCINVYLEFEVHYTNELNDIKREIQAWAERQGVRYTQKTIKFTHRVGFDRDSDFTLFAMTWLPDLDTRPHLAYQIVRVQNEKY